MPLDKHPAAYDPMLQDKIEQVCKSPEEWTIRLEIERSSDHLEYNKRMVRALQKEIERTEMMLSTLEVALINISELKKQVLDK